MLEEVVRFEVEVPEDGVICLDRWYMQASVDSAVAAVV